jgi:hypothetical protein
VLRCSCGQNMITNTSRYKGSAYHYYRCKREAAYGRDACPQRTIRIERVEPLVREFVVEVLRDPDTIRRGLEALVQRELELERENPEILAGELTEKLSENDRRRRAYQDQQAMGLMTLEAELQDEERNKQKVMDLERDREAVLTSLAESIPEALDKLTGEEINRVYRKLRLRVVPSEKGFDATGVLCTRKPTPRGRTGRRAQRGRFSRFQASAVVSES